jgi:hypothetical protein
MCMLYACVTSCPTEKEIEEAWDQNDDGGGIAWREDFNGEKVVLWKKGFETVESLLDFLYTGHDGGHIPFPLIIHLRRDSVFNDDPRLTHPFPVVDSDTGLELEGATTSGVLAHNGHWSTWKEDLLNIVIRSGIKLPPGPWSDTRAMAWIYEHLGPGVFELLVGTQKVAILSPEEFTIYSARSWNISAGEKLYTGYYRSASLWKATAITKGSASYNSYPFLETSYLPKAEEKKEKVATKDTEITLAMPIQDFYRKVWAEGNISVEALTQ